MDNSNQLFGKFVSFLAGLNVPRVHDMNHAMQQATQQESQRTADIFAMKIDKLYMDYFKCMQKAKNYEIDLRKIHVNNYDGSYIDKVEKVNQEMSDCIISTKSYWRLVVQYLRKYKPHISKEELKELENRHGNFVQFIKPLDPFKDEDQHVYEDFNKF